MKLLLPALALLFLALPGCGKRDSPAQPAKTGIELTAPFAYPAKTGEPVGVTYVNLANYGPQDDRLISASSEVAARIEIHESIEEDGVMKMRHRESGLPLPAESTLTMEPGGYHLMLMEMQSDLDEGKSYQLTLVFEKAGNLTIEVPIGLDIDRR